MNLKQYTIPGPYLDITINIREEDQDDYAVVREIFNQNVYHYDGSFAEKGVVLDIGANIGVFSLFVLNIAHARSQPIHIYAVEPEKNNLEILRKNIADNNRLFEHGSKITICEYGLSDFTGVARITSQSGSSRLTDDEEAQEITIKTFDQFIKENKLGLIDFCKVDIEGSEVPMILGSEKLNWVHRFAIEFDEHNTGGKFLDLLKPFIDDFSIHTLGVPSRGCNLYLENHNWGSR